VADTTRDIADDGLREFKLSGKRSLFLYMAPRSYRYDLPVRPP